MVATRPVNGLGWEVIGCFDKAFQRVIRYQKHLNLKQSEH
jgi:hypothetical protein